jgi:hypothetical protein
MSIFIIQDGKDRKSLHDFKWLDNQGNDVYLNAKKSILYITIGFGE